MNVLKVGSFIRDRRLSEKLSLRKMAGLAGVSIPYLSQVERGLRKPSAEILQAIAKGLRISAETLYVQAGILDERQASDVATSIMADMSITESQKRALLQIYRAFREEAGRAADASAVTAPALAILDTPKAAASSTTPKGSARTTSAGRPAGAKTTKTTKSTATAGATATGTIGRGHQATGSGRGRQAGGGTASQAGSSPHPAPTRSPATNPSNEEVQ